MIKFLSHKAIDFQQWDACVDACEVNLPYALSSYLNMVSPHWAGIVFEEKGVYQWVFPLTIKSKWGIKYLTQPIFTQQLGFYFIRKPTEEEKTHVFQLIKQKFWLVDITDNFLIDSSAAFNVEGKDRCTHHLDLTKSYVELYEGYNTNRKRVLKKMQADLVCSASNSVAEMMAIFEEEKGANAGGLNENAKTTLKALVSEFSDLALIYYVMEKGEKIAGGLFWRYNGTLIFLFGSTSQRGKKSNAMTLLFDKVIRTHATKLNVLDFEGSLIDGVSAFYKSFGGKKLVFNQLKYSRIPSFIKKLK